MNSLSCDCLDAYLDGDLPAEQCAAFEEHCADCAVCHAQLAAQAALDDAVRSLRRHAEDPPVDLRQRIEAATRGTPRRRWPLALAAAVVLSAGVWWTRSPMPPVQTESFPVDPRAALAVRVCGARGATDAPGWLARPAFGRPQATVARPRSDRPQVTPPDVVRGPAPFGGYAVDRNMTFAQRAAAWGPPRPPDKET